MLPCSFVPTTGTRHLYFPTHQQSNQQSLRTLWKQAGSAVDHEDLEPQSWMWRLITLDPFLVTGSGRYSKIQLLMVLLWILHPFLTLKIA